MTTTARAAGIIHAAIGGTARPEAFLLKMLFTAVTLGAGFKGGEIVPVFFTGATFGCTVAPSPGAAPLLRRGAGHGQRLLRRHQLPLTSLLLALELFAGGQHGMFTGQSLGLFAVSIARYPTCSRGIIVCIASKKSSIVSSDRNLSIKRRNECRRKTAPASAFSGPLLCVKFLEVHDKHPLDRRPHFDHGGGACPGGRFDL